MGTDDRNLYILLLPYFQMDRIGIAVLEGLVKQMEK